MARADGSVLLSLSDYSAYSKWFNRYFQLIKRIRMIVVVVWVAFAIWGAATGFGYIAGARDEMKAPDGSRAAKDEEVFTKLFHEQATSILSIIYIECLAPGCTLACAENVCGKKSQCPIPADPQIADFTHQVVKEAAAYSEAHGVGISSDYLGYYIYEGTKLDMLKCNFASADGKTTFITLQGAGNVKSDIRYDFVGKMMDDILPRLNPDPSLYRIGYTGQDPITRDGSGAAVRQSERIDAVTMPFAFALLAIMVRSWRLLLLALFNMMIAMAVSFGILNMVTNIIQKPPMTTTASFVEVLVLGFSVDYSLFLLRRYRDECKAGRHPEIAAKIMLAQAGHSVFMSSVTIICVFAGFIFLRSTDLMVQGMACVVSVAMCLMVNMTLTPSLLLLFPHFFSTFTFNKRLFGCCRQDNSTVTSSPGSVESTEVSDVMGDEGFSPENGVFLHHLTSPTARVNKTRGGPYKGMYFKLLVKITQWPYNILTLLTLYLIIAPVAYQVLHLRRNQNMLLAIPRNSQAAVTYKDMVEAFPGGKLMPIYVMVEAPDGVLNATTGKKLFNKLVTISKEIAEVTDIPVSSINSIAMANGTEIGTNDSKLPFWAVIMLLNEDSIVCRGAELFGVAFCDLYKFSWKELVNPAGTATLLMITIPFNPFANRIESFLEETYKVLDKYESPENKLHLCGQGVGYVEDMKLSFGEFPLLIVITCVVVFSLLGVMLQSAFVVLRLTLTVILPLAAVFGMSVIVYQYGALDWTGVSQVQSHEDGFYWYIPLLTFTMCIGLALDYDVFVISRIREHRYGGYSIRAAILKAVWEINTTVVAAGLIMALAFGGLLICDSTAVNQMSWILTTSVLFDTFVVQMVAVPAIMSLADNLSWWPYPVPTENLVTLEEEIRSHDESLGITGHDDYHLIQ